MSFNLPKVYPITDTIISGLSHSEQVERLIDGGATLIQLREKYATPGKFYRDAAAALRIARSHGARLIINDRVDLAMALRADGVHLGQSDMPVQAARRLLGDEAVIGFSAHNLAQVKCALNLPIDYLAFGPIYLTTTKENPDPAAGLLALRDVRCLVGSLPIVAIGGISLQKTQEVLDAGADCVAAVSALVANPTDIVRNLGKMMASAERATRRQRS